MDRVRRLDVAEKYDKFAKWYNIVEGIGELFIGRYRKRMLKNVRGKILEIGIGIGANLKYYGEECNIYGIDISSEMLNRARKRAEKLGKKVRLKLSSVQENNFRDERFDYVVDSLGFCTYENPVSVLNNVKKLLNKNGRILMIEHGESDNEFFRWLQRKREKKHFEKLGCSLSRDHIYIVKKAGFKIEKVERKLFGIIYIIKAKI
jgi:ubiquinone/menaquinone biosynthesis C-methylase UbiE